MPFTWIGCLDGSSVDLTKIDAFIVGQVQNHNDKGEPMFEDISTEPVGTVAKPIMVMCVFARVGPNDYPIHVVPTVNEAQLTIQSILGKLKSDYDKERGVVQVATSQDARALKLG